MSRGKLSILVLAIASIVVAACAAPTAPHHDSSCDSTCISGFIPGSG